MAISSVVCRRLSFNYRKRHKGLGATIKKKTELHSQVPHVSVAVFVFVSLTLTLKWDTRKTLDTLVHSYIVCM